MNSQRHEHASTRRCFALFWSSRSGFDANMFEKLTAIQLRLDGLALVELSKGAHLLFGRGFGRVRSVAFP